MEGMIRDFWRYMAVAAGWLYLLSSRNLLPSWAAWPPSPDSLLFTAGQSVLEDYGETLITIHLSQGKSWVTTANELWRGDGRVPSYELNVSKNHGAHLYVNRSDHIVCSYAIVTAHGSNREEMRILDEHRHSWLEQQPDHFTCLFHIAQAKRRSVTAEQHLTDETLARWRRRGTPKNPLALVNRYHAGLILLSLASHGRILTPAGGMPWFMYIDGDTMFANVQTPLEVVLRKLALSAERSSMESRVCGRPSTVPCVEGPTGLPPGGLDKIAIVVSADPSCDRGSFINSGAFFFQPSSVAGFVFTVLANSPLYSIDTRRFRYGDQAVFDWLTQRVFGIEWQSRLTPLCQPRNRPMLHLSCSYHEALLHRRFQWKQVPKMAMGLNSDSRALSPDVNRRLSMAGSSSPLLAIDSDAEQVQKQVVGSEVELLQSAVQQWLDPSHPLVQEAIEREDDPQMTDGLLMTCPRNFNAAGCDVWLRGNNMDNMDFYHCGDFLWHLFGCNKGSWQTANGILSKMMNLSGCHELLPRAPLAADRSATTRTTKLASL